VTTHSFRALCGLMLLASAATAAPAPKGAYARLEAAFELSGVTGDPFDFTQNDVRVTFFGPGGQTITVPAFYDGGKSWRVRFTPTRTGAHTLARVTRNGAEIRPDALDRRTFSVTGKPGPGFIRRDARDASRFVFDDGEVYYPLGHNAAWKNGQGATVPVMLAHMGSAGENWARIWMCHWDGKNLDWPADHQVELGTLDLEAARRWDEIIAAAEQSGVYLQIALQHHGQYSSTTDSNWNVNPWNIRNGGFLSTPEEFFTDARARALTRAKYRYIVARWGYSPAILAWELFNEVEWTDAIRNKREGTVAAWHREMATFLRAQDPNHHLVTTSSHTDIAGLYDAMDYVQPHAYPPDPIPAVNAWKPSAWHRPIFLGEIGPGGRGRGDQATFLHSALWASLMSESSGAAQFWFWDAVERLDLYKEYRAAAAFLKESRLASLSGMRACTVEVSTPDSGVVSFGPGAGWGTAARTEFVVSPSGHVEGLESMPGFLQGNAHREMFPRATFRATYAEPGTFSLTIRQVAKGGAHPVIAVDGKPAAEHDFPAAAADQRVEVVLTANVPAGEHVIRLENTGADWVVLERITLAPYGPALRALAKANKEHAALWLFPATAAAQPQPKINKGTVAVPGLTPGRYRVRWWDTHTGKELTAQTVLVAHGGALTLPAPGGAADLAMVADAAAR
jgi:Domain of unknown function (DUF5060)/Cellulase (glycosyl hydrolase family 5)